MEKTFTLRIDLESEKGIRQGVPKLLKLLSKYNMKASFYLAMGGESNIFEILRYRKGLTSSEERKIKVWSLKDKLRMGLLPRDFVKSNEKILRKILEEGHELGIHGFKHRAWTRGLDKIDIRNHILKAKIKYIGIFKRKPISFASPGFNINEKILKMLEKEGISFISDFPGNRVRFYGKIKNVPMTILGENKTPIIENLVTKGKSDREILEKIKKEIKKKEIISLYIHGLFEARFKLDLLEEIFKIIKKSKIENKRIIDY